MPGTSTPIADQHSPPSPLSDTSDIPTNTIEGDRLVQTAFISNPCSPSSSVSSIGTLRSRASFSALPRLTIPTDPSKEVASTRKLKRKREAESEVQPSNGRRPIKSTRPTHASTQSGSEIEAKVWEAFRTFSDDLPELLLSLPSLFQTLAEFKEERLESQARMATMRDELTRTRRMLQEHGLSGETAI